jgi:hypothetical protein
MTGEVRDRSIEMSLPVGEVRPKSNDSDDSIRQIDYPITRLLDY